MDTDHCQLRLMTHSDIDTVFALEQVLQSHPWKRNHFENCLAIGNLAWVIEWPTDEGSELAAYAIVSVGGGEAELLNVGVAPHFQGQGLASHFLAAILNCLPERAGSVFLEVRETNHKAIGLYHKLGFNQVGSRPNYYPAANGREDALILALELSAPVQT